MKIMFRTGFYAFITVVIWGLVSCSDGTNQTASQTAAMSLQAGIVYNFGGAQPVARNEFRLLNKSMEQIFVDTGFAARQKAIGNPPPYGMMYRIHLVAEQFEQTLDRPASSSDPKKQAEIEASRAVFQKTKEELIAQTVRTFKTDFNGMATLSDLPVGEYFIFGFAPTRTSGGAAYWNLRVQLNAGQNSIVLDQDNAEMVW